MSNAPQAQLVTPPPGEKPEDAAQLAHLANLHRMSRTAGLGSSEYAAVNVAAVAAIVLGLMSALSMITPVFLVVPVVGLVIAVVAIKQILNSHGTQTGMVLAILGLLACCGFTATTGYKQYADAHQKAVDAADLDKLVVQFGQDMADKKFSDAIALGDPRWQEQVKADQLEHFSDELTAPAAFGKLNGFKPTSLYDIQEDPETHQRMAVGFLMVDAARTADRPLKTEIHFRNNGDTWKIYALPEWFKPAAPAGAQKGAPQQPAGPQGPPAP